MKMPKKLKVKRIYSLSLSRKETDKFRSLLEKLNINLSTFVDSIIVSMYHEMEKKRGMLSKDPDLWTIGEIKKFMGLIGKSFAEGLDDEKKKK